jgi:hypothetical protein
MVPANSPQVHGVGQDVEGAAAKVGGGESGLVLIAKADGELETRGLPERPTKDLVDREHVGEDLGHLLQRDSQARPSVVASHSLRREATTSVVPFEHADGEV